MTTPFPRRLKLLVAINDAYARADLEEAYRLEDLHLAELTGRADRSDALIDRIAAFEACERKNAPRLDLSEDRLDRQMIAPKEDDSSDRQPPIDWDLVNREAAIGVELNRKAMTLWKKQQGDQRSSRRSDEQFNS
jgi:hypothetical protein